MTTYCHILEEYSLFIVFFMEKFLQALPSQHFGGLSCSRGMPLLFHIFPLATQATHHASKDGGKDVEHKVHINLKKNVLFFFSQAILCRQYRLGLTWANIVRIKDSVNPKYTSVEENVVVNVRCVPQTSRAPKSRCTVFSSVNFEDKLWYTIETTSISQKCVRFYFITETEFQEVKTKVCLTCAEKLSVDQGNKQPSTRTSNINHDNPDWEMRDHNVMLQQ